jgi:HemY protein
MWRALVFIGLLGVAAYGAVWLADRPGSVSVMFGGYEMQTTVAVAAVALAGIAFALAVLWSAVNGLVHLPSRINFASKARRRAKGYQAVSRGMVAVGAGDAIAARRSANEAERLLGEEPLALLLKAQAAQVSGNRAAAEAAFSRMMDNEETRVLGLRGLFVEARRRGDPQAAAQYALEAVRLAPAASWASDAVLEAQCATHDWRGALAAVDRRASIGLADRSTAKRHRAVLLTADALDRVERDPSGALSSAQEAVKLAPAASWASDAVLEAQCATHDWRGALAAVDRRASIGLADRSTAKRHRAVLLTADALDRVERDPSGALSSAQEAVKLAPDLVPAAALAGRLLAQRGDLRRGAKVVEAAWKSEPHPDLAEVYLNLRQGDSALDRLKRAETLLQLSTHHREGRLAVARAAIDAREFARAREVLEPLLSDRPTMRTCLMMADLEDSEHGSTGRGREWLARATRAPRDAAWIADGIVSDRWQPISPVTGHLDAFRWEAPPDVLVAPELHRHDDVTADIDDEPRPVLIESEPEPRAPEPEPPPAPAPEPTGALEGAPAAAGAPEEEIAPPVGEPAPSRQPEDGKPTLTLVEDGAPAADKPQGAKLYEPAPVIFPVEHAPDDPGAEPDKPARRGLFG